VLDLNERHVAVLSPMGAGRLVELLGWTDQALVLDVDGSVAGFVLTFAAGTAYDSDNYRWFTER
jgi:predicted GNAT superfamily acetyltransferase